MSIRKWRPGLCEWILFAGFAVAIAAEVLVNVVPLRESKAEIGGFPARKMYLKKMTGFSKKAKEYKWFAEEICKHYRVSVGELSDPVTAASNDALGKASPTKFCGMFRGCRDIEALRCVWYKKVGEAGALANTLMASGSGVYGIACTLCVWRINPRIIAALALIGGGVMCYGLFHFIQTADAMDNFQRTMVFVPYASLSGGGMATAVCCGLTLLFPLSTIRMVNYYKEAPDVPDVPDAEAADEPEE
jgi:hypothetical protein